MITIAITALLAAMLGSAAISPSLAGGIAPEDRKSGYDFMTADTRAMQDDDTSNPAMLWVLDGEALWNRRQGENNQSCADCHDPAPTSMAGVAARYPAFDKQRARPVDLEERINICRADKQKASPLPFESKELLAVAAYIGMQSRGMPIESPATPALKPFLDAGRDAFNQRQGQLNLSCAQCHDDHWGGKLAGAPIPQAHPTGYPLYRLEWQTVGSLQRRLRNCLVGMRAEAYPFGAQEYVNLELYLMWRARGMAVETPAVRP
jgi:sulfur-oxidizing protein SoxA